jgi:4-amino-4-deoxy-L-arabinose transferase-like glycosyltransferase
LQKRRVTRLTALLIAAALWAGIYLPGLGSTELKGEEGRRVMPAVTMLEGGSLVVPYVGGKPFLRKPPLVQWCIAGSMKVFGRNVWAARLPSALAVLALAAVIILATRGWLIAEQSLLAAIIMMTQVSMIEKCRLAEMEGIYVGLSGIAMVLWMSWWSQDRSAWLVWVVPGIFNGLAILAKAPMHLVFFYAVVIASLAANRSLRQLWSGPHLAGLAAGAAVVLAWYFPYMNSGVVDPDALAETVQRQAIERFTGAEFEVGKWFMNIPNGLANHLPWVLFVPLLWRQEATAGLHERTAALVRGGRWAVVGTFVVLLLIPGVLPRYVQPLAAPLSVLLAAAVYECPRRYRHWWRYSAFGLTALVFLAAVSAPFVVAAAVNRGGDVLNPAVAGLVVLFVFSGALLLMALRRRLHETVHLGLWTGLIVCMGMILYATCAVPWIRQHEDIRPFAERIDDAVPEGQALVAYGLDDFAPLLATLFYIEKTPIIYAPEAKAAPQGEHFFLVRGKDRKKFEGRFQVMGSPLAEWKGSGEKEPAVLVRAARTTK